MQTRVKVYPSAHIERIDQLHQQEIPFRAYEVLVSRLKAAIADEAEEQTCVIVQTPDGPQAYYSHTLSPLEESERSQAVLSSRLSQILAALPREGEAMTAEQVAALRLIASA